MILKPGCSVAGTAQGSRCRGHRLGTMSPQRSILRTFSRLLCLMVIQFGPPTDAGKYFSVCRPESGSSVSLFRSRDIQNKTEAALEKLTSGNVTIVVNVASFCRLTQQYHQFNALLEDFPNSLTVVGFPCDQFGHQEPGRNSTEILNTISYVRPGSGFKLHEQFHLMLLGDVNGKKEVGVYTYLKSACPHFDSAFFTPRESFWEPIKVNDITWNFEKFLIDGFGTPFYRFHPYVEPFDLREFIKVLGNQTERGKIQHNKLKKLLDSFDEDVQQRLNLRL